jgi:hypothetical protein
MNDTQNDQAQKADAGKPLAGQMVTDFAQALQQVAEVTAYGARKYSRGSWKRVTFASTRYHDALYRHLLAHSAGQQTDNESGLPHLAHAAWNILALLEQEQMEKRFDAEVSR